MRDFDLLQAPCSRSEVNEQTRTSTINGGTETGDFTRGGSARRECERGMPTAWIGALSLLPLAGGGLGRLGSGAEARCAARSAQGRSRGASQGGNGTDAGGDRGDHGGEPGAEKKSELGRFIPSTGGDESSRDADCRTNETTLRVASVSNTGGPGRAAQRLLRVEEPR